MPDKDNPSFEDMKLQVGARLQLMLSRSQKTIFYSALIGYVAGEYLLVKIPIDHGLSVPMQEGEHVTVRVFSGVAVYTFNCTIESILLAPRYYMHLSFPKTIQATPLRQAVRVKVNMPVEIKHAGASTPPRTATLADLSISGAFIAADGELGAPGDKISIAFTFRVQPTNQEVHIETDAIIRSCRTVNSNGNGNGNGKSNGSASLLHGVGIHFEGIGASEQVMLQHFLYEVEGHQLHF